MNSKVLHILLVLLALLALTACRQRVSYERQPLPFEVWAPDSAVFYLSGDQKRNKSTDSNNMRTMDNPLIATNENVNYGKKLFERYCKHCHGKTGNSDAPMIVKEKYPPPPKYRDKVPAMKDGELFNIIWFGKNLMPPNKNELNREEVWRLILYVRQMSKYPEEDK